MCRSNFCVNIWEMLRSILLILDWIWSIKLNIVLVFILKTGRRTLSDHRNIWRNATVISYTENWHQLYHCRLGLHDGCKKQFSNGAYIWQLSTIFWFFLNQAENADISYDLLKTNVQVVDINFCNSSKSYEGAMKPGMFCAGRIREGDWFDIVEISTEFINMNLIELFTFFSGGHDACQVRYIQRNWKFHMWIQHSMKYKLLLILYHRVTLVGL